MKKLTTAVVAVCLIAPAAAQAHPRVLPTRVAKAAISRWTVQVAKRAGADFANVYDCSRDGSGVTCTATWSFINAEQNCFEPVMANYLSKRSSRVVVHADPAEVSCQSSTIPVIG